MMELHTATRPEPPGLVSLRKWIEIFLGLSFSDENLPTLVARLERLAGAYGYDSLQGLAEAMECGRHPELGIELAQAVTINHTSFFREAAALRAVVKNIFPTFPRGRPARIWSSACSTGEEVYTLAMMAAETWGLENLRLRAAILGTDLSAQVVQHAERARYSMDSVAPVSGPNREKYLQVTGDEYQVRQELRDACTFRRLNLIAREWPFKGRFDLIFCRNVLYYFGRAERVAVLRHMHEVTQPGGFLVTSLSESLRTLDVPWEPVGTGLYRRSEHKF